MTFALPAALALTLVGCWTPPNANVQPKGIPGLIQNGITVQTVKDAAIVQSVDASLRSIVVKLPDGTNATYKVGAAVKNLDQIQPGNLVKLTVTEELTIYVLEYGRLPAGGGGATAASLGVNAKVLLVDPSYRLLTLQYPDYQTETFKVGLGVKLLEMSPGDDVAVRPTEVTAIRIEKP